MSTQHKDPFNVCTPLKDGGGNLLGHFYSLPKLAAHPALEKVRRLPISIRIVLESVLRHCDDHLITQDQVRALGHWNAKKPSASEVPFVVSRVILQDFTGVPLLVDLAAMRDAVADLGKNASCIEPLVPVDLIVDHSVQVDHFGTQEAFAFNLQMEFKRNRERYEFLKWGQEAFKTFSVVPPGVGIVHQVNLEHIAQVVFSKPSDAGTLLYPDTLVGTDSHTTMINGLGVVGWGVGGIEAEAAMLGQPVYFQTPEVVGVHLKGKLNPGVTATDLTLRLTELLRAAHVVEKFVEFFGEGAASLTLPDRATIANMAPEYGATMGFFPVDNNTLDYMRATGRSKDLIERVELYFKAQEMFGMPGEGQLDYSQVLELDLSSVESCVAGPKRPQDRVDLKDLKSDFENLFQSPVTEGGYAKPLSERGATVKLNTPESSELKHGSVVIAAITSCTNTSNPSVMLAAGLLAKKALERGLKVPSFVKTSLAPGSRVVSDYLTQTGLQKPLDDLGFRLVGYGCTTCIGNSGPLEPVLEDAIKAGDLVVASVLSGNRNFEARIHGSVRANYLMSPPLVVAFALAGRVDIDLTKEPIGNDRSGNPVYLKDLWPSDEEVEACVRTGLNPEMFQSKYAEVHKGSNDWESIPMSPSSRFPWREDSTYIQKPPFFENFSGKKRILPKFEAMRPLAIFGDSITTDHISPAGSIAADTPAGKYLLECGVQKVDFNSYGSRRGNDRVMTRGTFANVRIKNRMLGGREGGLTFLQPEREVMPIYDASIEYRKRQTRLIIIAGRDYGMGSSRDWAAKGTSLMGVQAVVAVSFERIHRSNLVGMGVLPLEFQNGLHPDSMHLTGDEVFDLEGITEELTPRQSATLKIQHPDGKVDKYSVTVRLDTQTEIDYYLQGGIMPYVLSNLLSKS